MPTEQFDIESPFALRAGLILTRKEKSLDYFIVNLFVSNSFQDLHINRGFPLIRGYPTR